MPLLNHRHAIAALVAALLPATLATPAAAERTVWQIGVEDRSCAEFTGPQTQVYRVPKDWSNRAEPGAEWPDFNAKAVANRPRPIRLAFGFGSVPEHGLHLHLGVMDATKLTPQMGVWVNDLPAGIIQTWGLKGTALGKNDTYHRVYRLYIPPEFLQRGDNEITLDLVPQLYGTDPGMDYLSWDFLRLTAPEEPVDYPIHGAEVWAGTNLTLGADGPKAFTIDENSIRIAQPLLEWLGIAYCGNPLRAAFWSDVSRVRTHGRETLEEYARLNMRVVLNTLHLRGFTPDENGELRQPQRDLFDSYMAEFGDLVQIVQTANEPGHIGPIPYENTLAFTKYVAEAVPDHVTVLGPGWAFNTWAADPANRKAIEEHVDMIGGHAYGLSFNNIPGGSFIEQLASYGPVTDGLPKPMIASEYGSNEWHLDSDSGEFTHQPNAAAFDRNMRAHIAFARGHMQHAAFFNHQKRKFEKFSLFVEPDDWDAHDVADTQAFPGVDGQDSRVQTYRRLALAYSTHGAPLTWRFLNPDDLKMQPVIVRCVDAAKLDPLPGSNATSDKSLISAANFSNYAQTVEIEVELPHRGEWTGKLVGPGATLAEAVQDIAVTTRPTVQLKIELPPRESVQYILTPPAQGD
ncbi:MAG: polysaccharide lyase family protein [Planctomycetota bacterium]